MSTLLSGSFFLCQFKALKSITQITKYQHELSVKTLNKVYLLRKVNGDLPYFQQFRGNFIFPPCFCYNWISLLVVFCGNFIGDFLEVS